MRQSHAKEAGPLVGIHCVRSIPLVLRVGCQPVEKLTLAGAVAPGGQRPACGMGTASVLIPLRLF
jgi:hypothetical protein